MNFAATSQRSTRIWDGCQGSPTETTPQKGSANGSCCCWACGAVVMVHQPGWSGEVDEGERARPEPGSWTRTDRQSRSPEALFLT